MEIKKKLNLVGGIYNGEETLVSDKSLSLVKAFKAWLEFLRKNERGWKEWTNK